MCLAKCFVSLDISPLLLNLDPAFNNFFTSSILEFLVSFLVISLVDLYILFIALKQFFLVRIDPYKQTVKLFF